MMGSDGNPAVAGGPARHIPVLGRRAVAYLSVGEGRVYIDATFGDGGYTREIFAAANCTVIGIDRDQRAVARAADLVQTAEGRLVLVEDRFSNLQSVARSCGYESVNGVVFDLGVSSMQLDQAERGFSFRQDGPLDMRMGGQGPSAADVLASASERELAAIIRTLGEERHARAIARAIAAARADAPILTTRVLAGIVAGVVHARGGHVHPATRTFQALRIFVNQELAELAAGLAAAEAVLEPGGRLVVISFHSLEDRIVKSFLDDRSGRRGSSRHVPEAPQPAPSFRVLTKRPSVPDESEIAANPRARSAKLRAAERTYAPRLARHFRDLVPPLPSLSDVVERRGSSGKRAVRLR
jgi:16S rRNA (cytosine1402-N4)-methyltransferase